MRHHKVGRKFGRKKGQRRAFVKSLLHNLIMKERMVTTEARAKEVTRLFGRLMSLAKKQTLASYRFLLEKLPQKSAEKLFKDIAIRYPTRKSGFIRVVKLDKRRNDGTQMAVVSLVEETADIDK